jgi:hypothetical protein
MAGIVEEVAPASSLAIDSVSSQSGMHFLSKQKYWSFAPTIYD